MWRGEERHAVLRVHLLLLIPLPRTSGRGAATDRARGSDMASRMCDNGEAVFRGCMRVVFVHAVLFPTSLDSNHFPASDSPPYRKLLLALPLPPWLFSTDTSTRVSASTLAQLIISLTRHHHPDRSAHRTWHLPSSPADCWDFTLLRTHHRRKGWALARAPHFVLHSRPSRHGDSFFGVQHQALPGKSSKEWYVDRLTNPSVSRGPLRQACSLHPWGLAEIACPPCAYVLLCL